MSNGHDPANFAMKYEQSQFPLDNLEGKLTPSA